MSWFPPSSTPKVEKDMSPAQGELVPRQNHMAAGTVEAAAHVTAAREQAEKGGSRETGNLPVTASSDPWLHRLGHLHSMNGPRDSPVQVPHAPDPITLPKL